MTSSVSSPIPPEYFFESAVATFIVSPEHKVIFWNKACEELTGIRASQILMTRNHWHAFYDEKRPCLVDIVIDGNIFDLPDHYQHFGESKLAKGGIRAEGWYENLGGQKRYIIFDAAPIYNEAGELVSAIETLQDITDIKKNEQANEDLIANLEVNIAKNLALRGYVPICSSCKNIRDKSGGWVSLESYFRDKADLLFSHGICPDCSRELYPELFNKLKS